MTDYKGIHEKIKQRDYDYRAGWCEERSGIWFAIGLALGLVVAVVGVLA